MRGMKMGCNGDRGERWVRDGFGKKGVEMTREMEMQMMGSVMKGKDDGMEREMELLRQ